MDKKLITELIKGRIETLKKQPVNTCRKQVINLQIAELEWVLTLLG